MSGAVSVAEQAALERAFQLARRGPLTTNPQVGCVIIDATGATVGQGWHQGAGTPHAEAAALADAGLRVGGAAGATAVVTLEPCRHTGRTPPCAVALIEAGISRVVYAVADPTAQAAGGAGVLAAAGVDVAQAPAGPLREAATALVRPWLLAHRFARPFVTWKFAATLDGRSAAADTSSRWITGPAARADVHARRGRCDTVLVGTGTVATDDPHLTVRNGHGVPAAWQPLRAVMGLRQVPAGARVADDAAPTAWLRTRDPHEALAALWERGSRQVWLEGGPRLAAAFLRAGLVDEVVAYLAPALLGAGTAAVADLGITTIAHALRLQLTDVALIGDDLRCVLSLAGSPAQPESLSQPESLTQPECLIPPAQPCEVS